MSPATGRPSVRMLLLAGTAAAGAALLAVLAPLAAAQARKGYTVEPLKDSPPEEAMSLRPHLASEGLRVRDPSGEVHADIWLRAHVPSQAAAGELGVKLSDVPPGTLLGVVRLPRKWKDFRGNSVPEGIFTLRYGLQPVDGDHQGVSETRDFALLCPAKADAAANPVEGKALVELSVQATGRKHPPILYLLKVSDGGAKLPRMLEDRDRSLWILEVDVPREAPAGGSLRLGLVLLGQAPEH